MGKLPIMYSAPRKYKPRCRNRFRNGAFVLLLRTCYGDESSTCGTVSIQKRQFISLFFISEKFRFFFSCILPDYVAHESPEEF